MKFIERMVEWGTRKSPWIIHFNAGACNGCDIEVVDAMTPRFDLERAGILKQGSPRHADVLVCTGAVTLGASPGQGVVTLAVKLAVGYAQLAAAACKVRCVGIGGDAHAAGGHNTEAIDMNIPALKAYDTHTGLTVNGHVGQPCVFRMADEDGRARMQRMDQVRFPSDHVGFEFTGITNPARRQFLSGILLNRNILVPFGNRRIGHHTRRRGS